MKSSSLDVVDTYLCLHLVSWTTPREQVIAPTMGCEDESL